MNHDRRSARSKHPGNLPEEDRHVHLGDEVKAPVAVRKPGGVSLAEGHPSLGVESDSVPGLADHVRAEIETADRGVGKLAGEKEGAGTGATAQIENPFRLSRQPRNSGGECGQVIRRPGPGQIVPAGGSLVEISHHAAAQKRPCGREVRGEGTDGLAGELGAATGDVWLLGHEGIMASGRRGGYPGFRAAGAGSLPGMSERAKILMMALSGLGLIVLATVLFAVRNGGGDDLPPASAGSAEVKDMKLKSPDRVVSPGQPARVRMETSEGDFTIELNTSEAPVTTNSFAYLVEKGFYDNLGFHRIVPGFVIQGGDPTGKGSGGPGYTVVEAPPKNLKYTPGTVAMAKTGAEAPGTSGSQFFVVTGSGAESLPPEYALVGRVTDGMDVVERIGDLGGPDERPLKSVLILRASLELG